MGSEPPSISTDEFGNVWDWSTRPPTFVRTATYDDQCPLCGGPPCDEEKHRRAREREAERG